MRRLERSVNDGSSLESSVLILKPQLDRYVGQIIFKRLLQLNRDKLRCILAMLDCDKDIIVSVLAPEIPQNQSDV